MISLIKKPKQLNEFLKNECTQKLFDEQHLFLKACNYGYKSLRYICESKFINETNFNDIDKEGNNCLMISSRNNNRCLDLLLNHEYCTSNTFNHIKIYQHVYTIFKRSLEMKKGQNQDYSDEESSL